jgi:hypothetical protein
MDADCVMYRVASGQDTAVLAELDMTLLRDEGHRNRMEREQADGS